MREGHPSSDQLYKVIGTVYADAYLRIEFLENENKTLRENQHQYAVALAKLRQENEELKSTDFRSKEWNNGSVNSMLPASLPEESQFGSTT